MQHEPQDDAPADDAPRALPVVAIGASAGGLKQLQDLFAHMPVDTGAAFVVMLHLSPDHTSELPALLGHQTQLEVIPIEDGMTLKPNRIHVLPAGHQPGLEYDTLRLTSQPEHGAMAGIIDTFFRELAEAKGGRAIGIVLSGSGSDGAAGAKAIKTHGGLIMVQAPENAEYDGMPRAVSDAVDVDFACDTLDLIEPLRNHLRFNCASDTPTSGHDPDARELVRDDQLKRIVELLHSTPQQHDFSKYKPNMLRRRMGLSGLADIDEYERRLRNSTEERQRLAQDFLISVTDFFRDPATYEALKQQALTELLDASDADTPLRIWVPGCATGEEAYSVAMCAAEAIEERGEDRQFVVFASDIDERALQIARHGLYPESIASEVSDTRLRLFFDAVDHHYRVKRRLRDRVVFAAHNVLGDPPYSNLDLISCRNLLMYLQTESQKRALSTFHFALNRSGFLFLGNSETIGEQIDLFEPVAKEQRLFRRIGVNRRRNLDLPFLPQPYNARADQSALPHETPRDVDEIEAIARNILLQEHVPATVLVNRKLEILCSYGPTRDYFTLPTGPTSLDLMEMVHESYRSSLRAVTHRAFRDDARSEVRAMLYDDRTAALRIVARPLQRAESVRGLLMVTFERTPGESESAAQPASQSDVESQLYDELEDTRHELQSTIQALEASNEDLKSSNEEILSMNEELQSTNEELETSKEELQSVNEELITVNDELESKVTELETAHDDLYNLFSGTQMATLFLDRALCIKRFTPTVRELLSVITSDVGRPLADITRQIDDPDLLDDADAVLEDLAPREKEIQAEADERWYLRRILAYRTQPDAIEGVVITFTDITDLKRAAMASRESEQQLDLAMSTLHGGIWDMALDPDQSSAQPSDRIYISPQLKALLGYRPDQFPDSLAAWRERILDDDGQYPDISSLSTDAGHAERRYRVRHRDGGIRWFSSQGRVISDERGRSVRWIGIDHDITAQKKAEDRTQQMQAQCRLLADAMPLLIIYIDRDGIVQAVNATWRQAFGRNDEETVGRPLAELVAPGVLESMQPCLQRALAGNAASNELYGLTPQSAGQDDVFKISYVPHTVDDEVLGCYVVAGPADWAGPCMNQLGSHSGLVYLQRMATIGELASTLAHDLRQPLSAINTYAGAVTRMLHAGKSAEDTTPYLRKIADQVKHANGIVDNTREFVGRRDAGMSRIDLNTLVQRALALTDGLLRNLNIEVRLGLDSPLPEISCYEIQIEQVIINLITNAGDAMEDVDRSARTLSVHTSKPDGSHVQLVIADSGDGIPADKIGTIFDPFYTSKLDGMGMGLALSRSIVDGHNGALWAESRPGVGTSFYLSLPNGPDKDAPDEQATETS